MPREIDVLNRDDPSGAQHLDHAVQGTLGIAKMSQQESRVYEVKARILSYLFGKLENISLAELDIAGTNVCARAAVWPAALPAAGRDRPGPARPGVRRPDR